MTLDHATGATGPKLKVQALLSGLTIAIGAVLLIFMITMEGEPGLLPLLLLVLGSAWYFITRSRMRARSA